VVSEAEFVASFQRRFPKVEWPSTAYECVSVDAENGSSHVWSSSSHVPPALAVASSCALPGVFSPVTVIGHQYMDGGVRSVTNGDLVRGCKTAIVLAPTVGPSDALPKLSVEPLRREVQSLQDSGCKVALIVPDGASMKAFGGTLADSSRAASALEAGRIQGRNEAFRSVKLLNN
jgi:NTE family protein